MTLPAVKEKLYFLTQYVHLRENIEVKISADCSLQSKMKQRSPDDKRWKL